MSLQSIHLRKLLKIIYLNGGRQVSALREDIRADIAREAGLTGSGGDFYVPFWHDAKSHALGGTDLHAAVKERVLANPGRANLYPRLRDGFLLWWNERRRWTNEPFQQGPLIKAQFAFPGIAAVVKVDSVLSVRDAQGIDHFIYPYFAPDPVLTEDAARLGLWLLINALPDLPAAEIRILDVIRGQTFSIDRYALQGSEEQTFRLRYVQAINSWNNLREEYE